MGKFMCTHEQACVRIIKSAYTGKIMHAQISTQKP